MNPTDARAFGSELETTLTLLHDLFVEVQHMEPTLRSARRIQAIMVALKQQPNIDNLPQTMLKIYAQVMEALSGIRVTRDMIQAYSADSLRATHARISEVNSTTESAAMEMLNGLDRTLAMIDQLQAGGTGDASAAGVQFDALRNEVNQLYGCLQFQDIITQQLHGVTAQLAEVEQRMEQVASLFDENLGIRADGAPTRLPGAPDPASFNAHASMENVADRQALIDEAFGAFGRNGNGRNGKGAAH
jgi:hypothetical protein